MRNLSFILTIWFSILFTYSYSQDELSSSLIEKSKQESLFHNGEQAPIFTLKDTSNQIVRLSDFRNNVVLLNFWGTYCIPCIADIPKYNKVQSFFNDTSNVVFISICVDNLGKMKLWKELIDKHKPQGIQLFLPRNMQQNEENSFYIDCVNNLGTPSHLLISPNGLFLGKIPNIEIMPYPVYRGIKNNSTGESLIEMMKNIDTYNNWLMLDNNLSKFMELNDIEM